MGPPPHGFVEARGARGLAWYRADLAEALRTGGLGPDDGRVLPASALGGRVPLRELVAGGRDVLVRVFEHGGLLGRFTGRRFRDPRRPFVELALAQRLAAVDVPVVDVVAARARPAGLPGGWHLEVASLREADALDLGAWLGRRRAGEVPARAFHRLLRAAGRTVARMHEVGFRHADLQPANLLALGDPGAEGLRVLALDLDRSRFLPDLSPDERHRNLARLWRHVRRREELYGPALTRGDRARFLVAWARGTRRGSWRDAWRAVAALEARGRGWHRLGWALERLAGGRRDARAHSGSASPVRRSRG